ncbi:MAG TPA: hypothetical protein ENJ09_16345 [Planctomycetes bacterium]|nr:hypothetical protein [Planctomycetota bacterium]
MKSRVLRYTVTGLFFLGLGMLWAFSYFFFNPFEGRFSGRLSMLVPRDVDFVVAKTNLAADLTPDLRLEVADEIEADPHGQALLEMPAVRELLDGLELDALREEIEASLSQLPIDVNPLDVFGGSELAVAGRFGKGSLAESDWAVYGRADWLGKIGMEAVGKGLVPLEDQGISLTDEEDGYALSGGPLQRTLHVTRLLDVVIVSTDPELISAAHALDQARGQDSFFFSAKFQNHAAGLDREGDVLDVYVDQVALRAAQGPVDTWPDPSSPDVLPRFLSRFIQLANLRESVSSVVFSNGVRIDATGAVSTENLSAVEKKFYRLRGFEKAKVLDYAKMAPQDTGIFACARIPMNDALHAFVDSLEPAVREGLADPARDVFGYQDLDPLLGDISTSFGDDIALFLRNHDYPADNDPDAPPADGTKVTAWALVLTIDDQDALDGLREHVRSNPGAFGIQGRNPNSGGIFTNEVAGGGVVYEYHTPFIPGTGHLATLEMFGSGRVKYFLISNSHELLGQVFTTYRGQRPPLSEDGWFQSQVNTGLSSPDVVFWLRPGAIDASMRAIAEQNAELDIGLAINWSVERPRIEKKVLKESFPGEQYGNVSAANRDAFELMVQEEIDAFERRFVQEHLGSMRRDYVRPWDALEIISNLLVELSLDPKTIQLHARAIVPLGGS